MTDALVIAGFGRQYLLQTSEGDQVSAVTRGRNTRVTVGDRAKISVLGSRQAVIESIVPRINEFKRSDAARTKWIAANLDQAGIVIAPDPPYSEELLLRVMIAGRAEGIPLAVIVNKHDLLEARARIEPRIKVFRELGYRIIECSARTDPDGTRQALLPWLKGRTTLLLGQSGMGKSTLINCLVPDAGQHTREISQALSAGRHTTTFTRMFELPAAQSAAIAAQTHDLEPPASAGSTTARAKPETDRARGPAAQTDCAVQGAGRIIDSPGFQSFGLEHLSESERLHAMPEFEPLIGECRFHNCTHRSEPGCVIREAADHGEIDPLRYRLFISFTDESDAIARAKPWRG